MELNPQDFKDQLRKQGLDEAVTANEPATSPAPVAAKTSEFGATLSEEEKEARKARYLLKANVTSTIAERIKSKAVGVNSARGQLLNQLTQTSAICGYVSKNGPKTDFYMKSIVKKLEDGKTTTSYKISLRQSAPSAPQSAIVRFPARSYDLINKVDVTTTDVADAGANIDTIILEVVPRTEWASMLNTKCQGFMQEAPEIFEPYFTKKQKIASPGDVKGRDGVSARPGMYLELSRKIMSVTAADRTEAVNSGVEKMFNIKNTFRTRIQTPKNTICMSKYQTVKMKAQYTTEEAANMISLYLKRFADAKDANQKSKIQNLDASQSDMFQVSEATSGSGATITASAYFPTNSADGFSRKPEASVYHWYNRDTNGAPVAIPFDEIALVNKIAITTKNGKAVRVQKDELKDVNATGDAYRLDVKGEHAAVFEATKGKLTYDDVLRAGRTAIKSKSGKSRIIPTVAGSDIAGCTPEDLRAIISQLADLG